MGKIISYKGARKEDKLVYRISFLENQFNKVAMSDGNSSI